MFSYVCVTGWSWETRRSWKRRESTFIVLSQQLKKKNKNIPFVPESFLLVCVINHFHLLRIFLPLFPLITPLPLFIHLYFSLFFLTLFLCMSLFLLIFPVTVTFMITERGLQCSLFNCSCVACTLIVHAADGAMEMLESQRLSCGSLCKMEKRELSSGHFFFFFFYSVILSWPY